MEKSLLEITLKEKGVDETNDMTLRPRHRRNNNKTKVKLNFARPKQARRDGPQTDPLREPRN